MKHRPRLTKIIKWTAAAAGFLAMPLCAHAGTDSPWYDQQYLTGDWGGARTKLAQDGVTVHLGLTSQFGGVFAGGKGQGTDYAQQLTGGFTFDLDKLLGLKGGTFRFYMNDRAGRNITSDYVGGKFSNFGIYGAGENFRLLNASYEQKWMQGRIDTMVGYYSLGNEFGNTPRLCVLTANAFCAHAQFFPNASGWLDAPTASWGGRIKYFADPSLYAEVGVFESNPLLAKHSNYGWHLGLQGATGVVIPLEIGKTVHLGPEKLLGHYKVGGYYDTSEVTDVGDSAVSRRGRYGGYILADQEVVKLDDSGQRNIAVFAQAMLGDKRTAAISSWFTAAVLVKGPLPSRPDDILAVGWAKANVNPRALAQEDATLNRKGIEDTDLYQAEELVEVDYNIRVLPWLHFTPDLQYDIDPGAFSYKKYQSAWIASGQLRVQF